MERTTRGRRGGVSWHKQATNRSAVVHQAPVIEAPEVNGVVGWRRSSFRGALNYHVIGIPFGDIRELDGWLRRRMRLYYWTAFAAIAAFHEMRSLEADRPEGRINNGEGLARGGGDCSR